MPLSDQRVLVTGASSGLGRALSVLLAQGGAKVVATARRPDPLEDLAERHAGVETRILDLLDPEGIQALCADAGPLTGAVLNAGVTDVGRFADGSDALDAAMIETNVMANIRLARGLHDALEGGRLVFVGSMAGQIPLPYQAVYSGTKAFLHNFALALREEWNGRTSVGVFEPGGIKTEMTDIDALATLQDHLADPDEVAAELLAFYTSDRAIRVPGRLNRLSAHAARLLPDATLARVMERIYRRD
ncbi:SDR family NAD(P)-dependent oxidoreductase [uncultured Algimonas sp.]|uniref:SDR family NAD(P)-dependent oxidoreductase n=1 Tax=uncultured Algimonas sp. TaxID=1547920 RepID=UPI002602D779|nr:SDR family NAD(P)-dependent oxidoreductase [uncultured Algimonas sp.]